MQSNDLTKSSIEVIPHRYSNLSEHDKDCTSDDEDDIPDDLEPLTQPNVELSSEDRKRTIMEPMEIEDVPNDDDDDDDLESLLRNSVTNETTTSTTTHHSKGYGCCHYERVGNVILLCQECPSRSSSSLVGHTNRRFCVGGGGVAIGPHWFGPMTVVFLVGWASFHFVRKASTSIGPISAIICICFMIATLYFLLETSYTDPGIVRKRNPPTDQESLSDYRWCDFCNVYQPPDGAHCPDCNVCISGYDHHCIWMGICIGKGNIKSFKIFNICWILYLLYCTLWVSFLGPIV
jgi:DHHC palmitoyltransferase